MRVKIIAAAAVAGVAVIALTCSSPMYLLRAGIQEAKILSRRRPIKDVIGDPGTSPEVKRKLDLVLAARTFARRELGLAAGESFTTYSWLDGDTLAHVISAARKDAFEVHTWWFPIVGNVPYKGFFDIDEALAAAAELARKGYDTYMRPTSAFSTLGWFNDPLLSTTMDQDNVSLVATVIHELTHNTIYVPSQVSFNESFASFVGDRGAAAFFCGIEDTEGERCRAARARWHDNILFGRWLEGLIADLEALYAREDLAMDAVLDRRAELYDAARERFRREIAPKLATDRYRGFGEGEAEPNNARLVAWRLYYDRLYLFEKVFQRNDRDLAATITAIQEAASANPEAPFEALERLAGE